MDPLITSEKRMRYLKRRHSEVNAMLESLERGDYKLLVTIGHQMQGTAPTFGFEMLALLGQNLEQAGNDQNQQRALTVISSIQSIAEQEMKRIE